MKNIIYFSRLIDENTAALDGVFTTSDLANILNTSEKTLLPRKINQLEKEGVIARFMRGIYVCPQKFNPLTLSHKICPETYLSLDQVLADNAIIGTIPQSRITAVKIGKSCTYTSSFLTVEHVGLQKDLYFGFDAGSGFNTADSEKAFLDCLYFYQKGRKPSFSVYEDINIDRLSLDKVEQYLSQYKNKKFIAFVRSIMKGPR